MSVPTIFLWSLGVGSLGFAAIAVIVIHAYIDDRRADRDDEHLHTGHARPRESWRTRFQAWLTARYGPSKNVPALVVLPPDASAGTSNLPGASAARLPIGSGSERTAGYGRAGEPYVTVDPRAAVTVQGRVCEETASASRSAAVPDAALDPIHRIDLQEQRLYAAGENERNGYWHPRRPAAYLSSGGWNPLALGSTDTGYSKKDAALLGVILEGDAATVQIRRRFADLEVRDQARFARITAGIKAGAA